jgi:hypothetical protein
MVKKLLAMVLGVTMLIGATGCFLLISSKYNSFTFGLWTGLPITTTLLFLSNKNT